MAASASTTAIRAITSTCGAFGPGSDSLYSFRSLHDAYVSCRRRKRNTINALRFEASLLDNLTDLSSSLQDGSYRPSRSVCFVAKQPKLREIFAADFRDRVVHHLLVPQIEKIFEPKFIHDSYACRTGKGTHAAVERLKVFMHRVTKSGRAAAWFMQLDIRSFFMSIDREILMGILEKNIRKELYNNNPQPPLLRGNIEKNTPLNPLFLEGKVPPLANGKTTCKQYGSLNPTLEKGGEGGFFRIHLREEKVWQLRQTFSSYLGHFKYANSYKLTRTLFEKYEYLKDIFTINDDGRLIPLYEPPFEPYCFAYGSTAL